MKLWYVTNLAVLTIVIGLMSCEHKVSVQSIVHEDGSVDRTIQLTGIDSVTAFHNNMFDITRQKGWDVEAETLPAEDNKIKTKYAVTYKKHFPNVEEMNREMNPDLKDSVFCIRSGFQKKFRWFYTYTSYSDTYVSLNRFKEPSQDDYFTPEDFLFIERLPAEGKPISKADSFYLDKLNERIMDYYGMQAILEEQFKSLTDILLENKVNPTWIDSLQIQKHEFFKSFLQDKDEIPDDHMLDMLTIITDPVPNDIIRKEFLLATKKQEAKLNFLSGAITGKYTHGITLPGKVYNSNADSVSGNNAYWTPPVIRFMLKDYTMTAQSRELNLLPTAASVIFLLLTVFLFIRKRRSV